VNGSPLNANRLQYSKRRAVGKPDFKKICTRHLGQKVPEMTPGLHADVTI
jgi:hypothetical protein